MWNVWSMWIEKYCCFVWLRPFFLKAVVSRWNVYGFSFNHFVIKVTRTVWLFLPSLSLSSLSSSITSQLSANARHGQRTTTSGTVVTEGPQNVNGQVDIDAWLEQKRFSETKKKFGGKMMQCLYEHTLSYQLPLFLLTLTDLLVYFPPSPLHFYSSFALSSS